jgi:hypothetical protein
MTGWTCSTRGRPQFPSQVGGEPIDDLAAPAFIGLAIQNQPSHPPAEAYKLSIDRSGGPHLGAQHILLHLLVQLAVTLRQRLGGHPTILP